MTLPTPLHSLLCCPTCGQELTWTASNARCAHAHSFSLTRNGIPILVGGEQHQAIYQKQIDYFSRENASTTPAYVLAPWMRKYVDLALRHFGPPSTDAVALDIGCGSGYMTIELARAGYRVVAADLTPSTIIALAHKVEALGLRERVLPVISSALDLPVHAGCVNAVVGNAIIEHLPDDNRFAGELARVCASGAKGMLVAPVKLRHVWPMFWPVNYLHDRRIGHLRRYDAASFEQLLARHGFALDAVGYTGHLRKVAGVLLQMLLRTHRWDEALERLDAAAAQRAYGSSNVIVTFHKA